MGYSNILALLLEGKVLLSDGAMGTMLHQQGLQPGESPDSWCIERPDVVRGIAEAYVAAGSDIVETNTFGASSLKLKPYGLTEKVSEINRAAVTLARAAVGEHGYVAGSMGPSGHIVVEEGGDLDRSVLYQVFKEQAIALAEAGADFILIETMSSLPEAVQAIRAARENTSIPVACTFTFQRKAKGFRTMMGVDPSRAAREAASAGAQIVGSNCSSGIEDMIEIASEMRAAVPDAAILMQPNAGAPVLEDGKTVFKQTPGYMASRIPELLEAGANIVGGCCGTSPAHISAMAAALRATEKRRAGQTS